MPKWIFIFSLFPFLSYSQKEDSTYDGGIIEQNKLGYYSQSLGIEIKSLDNQKMYDAIITMMGTNYKYGGKSENGIDCSGFVNFVFKEAGWQCVGNCSADMYNNIRHISKNKLREGDLVFFKTRKRNVSHVGLYLGQNKFAHSSTSSGVIISDLDEDYYQKRFAKGGRINRND
jgi:murein DD-endopeptidase / murein LD-carboxypeptidase